ncbi:MAG: GNAT family N-acetyltransferase [Clostridia bacterium]|nr:GNAT family N-acetyltransferase [Clostridia bacterium]
MSDVECKLVKAEDYLAIKEIWEDFNKSPYARFDRPHSTDEEIVKAMIAKWAEKQSKGGFSFAVWTEGKMIGFINFVYRGVFWETSYCFHSAYQGQGLAKKAMEKLKGFILLYNKKVIARTAVDNLPSVAFLSAVGFEKIGEEKVSFYNDESGAPIYFIGGIYELKER